MLNYYRMNEDGVIIELLSFSDPIPVYDELNNIIGYTDDVNDYIKANYIKTTSEIIQSVDGTYIFAENFNHEEEARKKEKIQFNQAKEIKLNLAKVIFAKKRDKIRFIQLDEVRKYGFDCAIEDVTNFMASYIPLLIAQGGTTEYKVYLNEENLNEKKLIELSFEDMHKTYSEVSIDQKKEYKWYEVVKFQIENATTMEELDNIILE